MSYYSKDLYHDLESISKLPYFNEWLSIVKPFLLNDELQRRKLFRHHDDVLWNHLIQVSFRSFLVAKYYHVDEKVCAIAGLLHDFYPKAYKYSKELAEIDHSYLDKVHVKQKLWKMHGFTHAKEAADNARKFFPGLIDDKTYSCIKTHMFPLTPIPPKYKEGWIVTLMDKRLSANVLMEVKYLPKILKNKVSKKNSLHKLDK